MGKYLLQDKLVRAFTKGVGSSYSAALNILLFLSILISVVTPYTYLGLGLVLVISAIEIWFVLNVFLVLRSTSVGYKIIDATFEWNISDPNTKIIRSKKKFVVRLTQFVNSICYYLEPGERIIQTSGVLPEVDKTL